MEILWHSTPRFDARRQSRKKPMSEPWKSIRGSKNAGNLDVSGIQSCQPADQVDRLITAPRTRRSKPSSSSDGDVDRGIPVSGGSFYAKSVGGGMAVDVPSCRDSRSASQGYRYTASTDGSIPPAHSAIEGSVTSYRQAQVTEATTRPAGDKAIRPHTAGAQVILRPSCRDQTQKLVP